MHARWLRIAPLLFASWLFIGCDPTDIDEHEIDIEFSYEGRPTSHAVYRFADHDEERHRIYPTPGMRISGEAPIRQAFLDSLYEGDKRVYSITWSLVPPAPGELGDDYMRRGPSGSCTVWSEGLGTPVSCGEASTITVRLR